MERTHFKIVVGFLCCSLAFLSCKEKTDCCDVPPVNSKAERVFVVCEGSLGNGNSALTLYVPSENKLYEDVYKPNNQQGIGDVFQSMVKYGDDYLLVVNNSDKILKIDGTSFQLKSTASIPKPRYIQQISSAKAYVSTLFSDKLYTLDPSSMQVTGSMSMPAQNPEGMCIAGNKLIVCNWDTSNRKLYSIDIATGAMNSPMQINEAAPQEAVTDKNGKLWVLTGNVAKGKDAHLLMMDPNSGLVVSNFAFPSGADPIRLVMNNTKDSIYFIEVNYNGGTQYNGVYRMSIAATSLPAQPFVAAQQFQYFWALGIEPKTGNIFIGDPKGFIQKGVVYIYSPTGTLLNQFATGVGPGHFYFDGY